MATDTADQIRLRRRELKELGFQPQEIGAELGPEAQEQEFTDRFKDQYTARQAKLDAQRAQESAAQASEDAFTDRFKRQYTARQERQDAARADAERAAAGSPLTMDAAMGDRQGLMRDMIPQGQLVVPGMGGPPEYSAEDTSLQLPTPEASPGAKPDQPGSPPPRPAIRRPQTAPPNVPQDMTDSRQQRSAAGASAARAASPVAQLARERMEARRSAAQPGGLNVSDQDMEAARTTGQASASRPAPAQSGQDELAERERRAAESREIDQYNRAQDKYEADYLVWRTQFDAALEGGDQIQAQKLAKGEPQPPEPPMSVTGDLEPNEVRAVHDHDNDPSTPRIAETSQQTLARLQAADPQAYEALRATAQAAVGTDRDALREWISANFGEMTPEERYDAMRLGGQRLAANNQNMTLAMPQGSRGGIGSPGRTAAPVPASQQALDPRTGKPLTMRDPFNGGRVEALPQAAGGLVPTTTGNRQRAPQRQDALQGPNGEGGLLTTEGPDGKPINYTLETFPTNPERMTPQWRNQMLGIGAMAFGLNREDFAEGPDGDDMFIAATQKMLTQHQGKVNAGFEAVPEITGGYTYRPNQAARDRSERRRRDKEVDSFLAARPAGARDPDPNNPSAMIDSPEAIALREAAANGTRDQYLAAKDALLRKDREDRRDGLNTARRFEADQKNRNNPARAPGMFRASLAQAGNDPEAQAAVYANWGMPREAERIRAMDVQRQAYTSAAEVERAKIEGERGPDPIKIMRQTDAQIADGLMNPDATMPMDANTAVDMYARVHGQEGKPLSAQDALNGVASLLLNTRQPAARMHPVVQRALDGMYAGISWFRSEGPDSSGFVGRREMFILEARALGMDAETAGQEYDRRATSGRPTRPAPAPAPMTASRPAPVAS
jgi:hypothetical protein